MKFWATPKPKDIAAGDESKSNDFKSMCEAYFLWPDNNHFH